VVAVRRVLGLFGFLFVVWCFPMSFLQLNHWAGGEHEYVTRYTSVDLLIGRRVEVITRDEVPAGSPEAARRGAAPATVTTLRAAARAQPYAWLALGLVAAGAVLSAGRRWRAAVVMALALAAACVLTLAQHRLWSGTYAELTAASVKSKHADWVQPGYVYAMALLAVLAVANLIGLARLSRPAPTSGLASSSPDRRS
jgi:hypothetical protein